MNPDILQRIIVESIVAASVLVVVWMFLKHQKRSAETVSRSMLEYTTKIEELGLSCHEHAKEQHMNFTDNLDRIAKMHEKHMEHVLQILQRLESQMAMLILEVQKR